MMKEEMTITSTGNIIVNIPLEYLFKTIKELENNVRYLTEDLMNLSSDFKYMRENFDTMIKQVDALERIK